MTNEELLQQAKDQLAVKQGFTNWTDYMVFMNQTKCKPEKIALACHFAAINAIQSAREEAAPKWIDVIAELPPPGEHVLLLIPKESGDGHWQCIGFYAPQRHTECWCDEDNVPGIDYDKEEGTTWLMPGFYEEEEQYRGDSDYHYIPRKATKWQKIIEPKS